MSPTEVLIWGSPQGGTQIRLCAQTVGIVLPQKALVCQDAKGDVYLAWNDPLHPVKNRHETSGCTAVSTGVAAAIAGFAGGAT